MNYQIRIKPAVAKELKKLNKKDYYRVLSALTVLSSDPLIGKKLAGEYNGSYTYRVWPYSIIYQIYKKDLLILVV